MSNPLKAIAKVVAAPVLVPVTVTTQAIHLVGTERAAVKVADAAQPLSKSWHQSKTVWFNLIVAILALLPHLPIPPKDLIVIGGVGNVLLRLVTVGPVNTLLWLAKFAADAPLPPAPPEGV